jgi:YD repeat-containing protein
MISQSIVSPENTLTTLYSYDSDGRMISETDTLGNTSSYTYNKLNQLIQVLDAKNITTEYEYDYRGNIISESREGRDIFYSYDIM